MADEQKGQEVGCKWLPHHGRKKGTRSVCLVFFVRVCVRSAAHAAECDLAMHPASQLSLPGSTSCGGCSPSTQSDAAMVRRREEKTE